MERAHVLVVGVGSLLIVALVPGLVWAENTPPEAEAGLDQQVEQGAEILLDAGGSHDPDGTITAYEWTIVAPNGTAVDPSCVDCEESSFLAHRVGTYEATVTVTDDDGASRSDTLYVEVSSYRPPTVTLDGPDTVTESGEFRANASAGEHDLNYLVWRVDGEQIGTRNATGESALQERQINFSTTGEHFVSVTVHDYMGGIDNASMTVQVAAGDDGPGPSDPPDPPGPSDPGPDPAPLINITDWPQTAISVDENATFRAETYSPDGSAIPITWEGGAESGPTAALSFDSPGEKTVTATAHVNTTYSESDEVTVVVVNRSGPLADMTIEPQCAPERQDQCGSVVTTTEDPIRFTSTAKPGGGDVAGVAWIVDGSVVSNAGTYEDTFPAGEHNVTLSVEDQYGTVDSVTRTFYVKTVDGLRVDLSLTSDLDEVCSASGTSGGSGCSWNPSSQTLTVVEGTTTRFEGTASRDGEPVSVDQFYWDLPEIANSPEPPASSTQEIHWNEAGTGTIVLEGDVGWSEAVDTATVEVVSGDNRPPSVEITDVTKQCGLSNPGRVVTGCFFKNTEALEVSYRVSDPDEGDVLSVEGRLSPGNIEPIKQTVRDHGGSPVTQTIGMPVEENGDHTIRVSVFDGSEEDVDSRDPFIAGKPGKNEGDFEWELSASVFQNRDSKYVVKASVKCSTEGSKSCEETTFTINWGDGDRMTFSEDDRQNMKFFHTYTREKYPKITLNSLKNAGRSVSLSAVTLDLEDKQSWKNREYLGSVTATSKPNSAKDNIWFKDKQRSGGIQGELTDSTWVSSKNRFNLSRNKHSIIDKKTDVVKSETTYSLSRPGPQFEKSKSNAKRIRTRLLETKWFDLRQYGAAYKYVGYEKEVITPRKWRCWTFGPGDMKSWTATGGKPSGVHTCDLIREGESITRFHYEVYETRMADLWHKHKRTTRYKVGTFEIKPAFSWEKWRFLG